ncbi:MAG: sulfide/dihydroorotate dehydrogenase-like FAD/NAD-binding protein [Candidatus Altiarchaeota archaeon]
MYKIVKKRKLNPLNTFFEVEAPLIASSAKPGQFVVLIVDEKGERIPLTIMDWHTEKGTIDIVSFEVGTSTSKLAALNEGDNIAHVSGPFGRPIEVAEYGIVVCVGGGVGIAAIYPKARAYKEAGNKVISIIGARNKDLLVLEEEMADVSDELIICTDDGSKGRKGFVTEALKAVIKKREVDKVTAVGPLPMMKAVADLTKGYGIKTVVSLNSTMVDGTGMCGGCRVKVEGQQKFTCVHGPIFDAHKVDFDDLIKRNMQYSKKEKDSMEKHKCRLQS